MRRLWIAVLCVLFLAFVAQPALGEGRLGKRYIGFTIGQVVPGDEEIEEVDDSILQLSAGINLVASPNVDVPITFQFVKMEGEMLGVDVEATGTHAGIGINYHFSPGNTVNPYISVEVGYASMEAEASLMGSSYTEDEDEFAYGGGLGIEVALGAKAAFRPQVAYSKVGDADSTAAGASLMFWLNETIFSGLSASYGFEDGDVSYSFGFGFAF